MLYPAKKRAPFGWTDGRRIASFFFLFLARAPWTHFSRLSTVGGPSEIRWRPEAAELVTAADDETINCRPAIRYDTESFYSRNRSAALTAVLAREFFT